MIMIFLYNYFDYLVILSNPMFSTQLMDSSPNFTKHHKLEKEHKMYSRELIMFDEFVLEVKVKVDDLNPVALHEELCQSCEVKLEMPFFFGGKTGIAV